MARQQLALARLHPLGLFVNRVIPAQQVQHPVHHEERYFVVEGNFVFNRVTRGDGRADDDVTDELGNLGQRGLSRSTAPGVGDSSRRLGFVVDRKTEYVRRTVVTHELLIEIGDRGFVGKDERHFGESAHALVGQRTVSEIDPSLEIDLVIVLFVSRVDVDTHERRSYAATMSATIRWRTTSFVPR